MLQALANATPHANRKYQVFFIGDSITAGIGTTGTSNNADGLWLGPNAYPIKTLGKLDIDVTGEFRLFPGQKVNWYETNDLATTVSLFDKDNYTDFYAVMFWGANDLVEVNDTTFRTNLSSACLALQAAGAKVIVVPVLSRKDSYAASVSYINITRRNAFNTWLYANYSTFADTYVDLSAYPEIFADDAPDNGTYFGRPDIDGLSGVHLTDDGAEMLATAVADTIMALSTSPSIPIAPFDDAAAFITATGISDSTIISAIETLVSDLKSANLWHRLHAVYPFVGGTSGAHKFNLKDPRDNDLAFRLTFSGSPVHDNTGVTWASGAYADTKLSTIASVYVQQYMSLHYYSRSATPATTGIDIGCNHSTNACWLGIKLGSSSYTPINDGDGVGIPETYSALGLFCASRSGSPTKRSLYKNGVLVRDTTSNRNGPDGYPIYIGCANANGSPMYPSARNCAYAAIGHGLTAGEEAAHYTIIQAFQTALGRAV